MKNLIIITLLLIAAGARAGHFERHSAIELLNSVFPLGQEIIYNGETPIDQNQCLMTIKNESGTFSLAGGLIVGDQPYASQFFKLDLNNELFEVLEIYKDRTNVLIKFLKKKDEDTSFIQLGVLHIRKTEEKIESISLKVKRNTILAPFKILNCNLP
jgi:hypothetical protein